MKTYLAAALVAAVALVALVVGPHDSVPLGLAAGWALATAGLITLAQATQPRSRR